MKNSLTKIVKKVDVLRENEQGQLKGGFASLSSVSILKEKVKNRRRCNQNCTVNNCVSSC